ncbi:MAG: hypothetical protein LC655_04295 [Bacteroidales bacterium]|nr:hypothetical protein [Bacteroidales bacterium]
MKNKPLFAEVILPLALKGTFTYLVAEEDRGRAVPGMRVMVQFGQKKIYSGIISEVHRQVPEHFTPKPILSFPDDQPLVTAIQLQFWNWISVYYMCTIGEVMHAALPGGLKLTSETVLQMNHAYQQAGRLDEQEMLVMEFIGDGTRVSLEEIRRSEFGNDGLRIVKGLIEKGALHTLHCHLPTSRRRP